MVENVVKKMDKIDIVIDLPNPEKEWFKNELTLMEASDFSLKSLSFPSFSLSLSLSQGKLTT